MRKSLESQGQIPNSLYYVTMTDRFLSGWGEAADCNAKYVATCSSYQEAKTVANNAEARGDQKHINIRTTKPRVTDGNRWELMTKETNAVWYTEGTWKKKEAR